MIPKDTYFSEWIIPINNNKILFIWYTTFLVRVCQLLILFFSWTLFKNTLVAKTHTKSKFPHQSFDHDKPLPLPHITPQINIFFFFLTTFSLSPLPTILKLQSFFVFSSSTSSFQLFYFIYIVLHSAITPHYNKNHSLSVYSTVAFPKQALMALLIIFHLLAIFVPALGGKFFSFLPSLFPLKLFSVSISMFLWVFLHLCPTIWIFFNGFLIYLMIFK